jgi:phasin family protein
MSNTGFDPIKNPFPEIATLIEQFRIPGVDLPRVIESQRHDIEALTKANVAAYAGMQELARRQTEILQETMAEWQAAMTQVAAEDAARVAVGAQRVLASAFSSLRDLAEMTARSQTQAWEAVQQRFQDNLGELRRLMQPPKA